MAGPIQDFAAPPKGDAFMTAVARQVGHAAGAVAEAALVQSLPLVSAALSTPASLRSFLHTVEELVHFAPECTVSVLKAAPGIVGRFGAPAFRGWVLQGLRLAQTDAAQAAAYFAQADSAALAPFVGAADGVLLGDMERPLRSFFMALWHSAPILRVARAGPGARVPRRAAFDAGFFRVPESFAGFSGQAARHLFYATLAHLGAHRAFTPAKFPVGTLKPLQIALVGLIEDARVETLAAQQFPGLRRLWQPFHTAQSGTALTAELLMARLSRALLDPGWRDDDPWVNKGRLMFFEAREHWHDLAMSRRIGGLLGNDLGQMRIQFNAKTYVVEPPYRDDNAGLWDFGAQPPEQVQELEMVMESVRLTQQEQNDQTDHREDDSTAPAPASARLSALPDDAGLPIASLPEWDHVSAVLRRDWVTVKEYRIEPAAAEKVDAIIQEYAEVEQQIARFVAAARVSRPLRLRAQTQGDRLDLDASIRLIIDRRAGFMPDTRIFEASEMRARDISVLVLLDISESTRARVKNSVNSVLALEKTAAALLAQAMAGLGDPFAIHAFCSNGREDVHYYRVKDFDEAYAVATRSRLAGLKSGLSTRLGAALRQAGAEIAARPSHRRLILLVTDGEPSDIDVADQTYLVEDARKATQDLARQGIDVFCVGLDGAGAGYLRRIFGLRKFTIVTRIDALPKKLPLLYYRLFA